MRIPVLSGNFAAVRHSQGVMRSTPRAWLPLAVLAGMAALTAGAVAAPPDSGGSARPERPDKPERPERPEKPERPDKPDKPERPERPAPNPITPAPTRPGSPATPANPIAGGNAPASPGTRTGGTTTTPGTLSPVPRGVRTSGLTAGRGQAQVRYFADLGDVATASGHMAVIPSLLARLSSEGLGTIALRPLVVTGDANSTEAACAVIAAIGPNRAWYVAHHLAAARVTRDGNWVTPAVLGAVARKIAGLSAKPQQFVRASSSRACFPQLNRFRLEATRAGVGSSPTYVITGDGGTTRLAAPASVEQVVDAIRGVGG